MAADIAHFILAARDELNSFFEKTQGLFAQWRGGIFGSPTNEREQLEIFNAVARGFPSFGGNWSMICWIKRAVLVTCSGFALPEIGRAIDPVTATGHTHLKRDPRLHAIETQRVQVTLITRRFVMPVMPRVLKEFGQLGRLFANQVQIRRPDID